jgi:hypothetical protein
MQSRAPRRTQTADHPTPLNTATNTVDTPPNRRQSPRADLARLVAPAAVGFSALYVIADLIEVAQGDFSTLRLALTYVAEAAIPFFVIGLYALQRPRIGRLGLFGAVVYAYSYIFFTATVVYALAAGTPTWNALGKVFGAWMTVHGLVMVVGGLSFGLAIVKAGVLPRWTGVCLMVGVMAVAAASGLPNIGRTVAEAVPATAFTGMGLALLSELRKPDVAI